MYIQVGDEYELEGGPYKKVKITKTRKKTFGGMSYDFDVIEIRSFFREIKSDGADLEFFLENKAKLLNGDRPKHPHTKIFQ